MKCPYCNAGISVDGDKSVVQCSSCNCDVDVRSLKFWRVKLNTREMEDDDEEE